MMAGNPENECAIADECRMDSRCPNWTTCQRQISDETLILQRIEKRVNEIAQFLDTLGPMVVAAQQFMASPSFKLMGKLQRDKTGKAPK